MYEFKKHTQHTHTWDRTTKSIIHPEMTPTTPPYLPQPPPPQELNRTTNYVPCLHPNRTNLMTVRRFTVAFFQIFTKGFVELLAEIGSARQRKNQNQTKATEYAGQSVTGGARATMHLHDGRTICSHSFARSTLSR